MASTSKAAAAATWSTQPLLGRRAPATRRASRSEGGGVLAPRCRYALRRGSNSSGLPIIELLSQAGEGSGEVTAGGPGLASDERRAFVERVAVFVVERDHGTLRAGEAAVAAVEIQIGVLSWLSLNTPGFGEPESGK